MRVRAEGLGLVCWSLALLVAGVSVAFAQSDLRVVEAAKDGDAKAVRALLKDRADVNTPRPDGATALHWTVQWDDVETADLLIRAGAKVNVANAYGVMPLSLACTNGSAGMVEKLLTAGANPNAASPTGETPLMTCAGAGGEGAVKALLARGIDVNAKGTPAEQTALMWAAAEGHVQVVRALIEHRADVNATSKTGFTALMFAARGGHFEPTRALLAAGANVNKAASNGMTALVMATIRGHLAFAAFLLDQGADPNAGPGFNPLHWAVGSWETGTSAAIVSQDNEWRPLAGLRGPAKLEFVQLLLARGADPNVRAASTPRAGGGGGGILVGGTPFVMAARAGDVPIMRLLLDNGADPSLTTKNGTTALMLAAGLDYDSGVSETAESDALEAVKLCYELGLEVDAVNADGDTALHGVATMGADSIAQFLAEKGANLNVKNQMDWTPLVIAEGVYRGGAIYRYPSTAELLLKLGATPSPPDVERDHHVVNERLRDERLRREAEAAARKANGQVQ